MNEGVINLAAPRATLCGTGAVLLDAEGPLSLDTQRRIWALADEMRDREDVIDVQPGMNNLLVMYDIASMDLEQAPQELLARWNATPVKQREGRTMEVPVIYGGELGMDMPDLASFHKMTPEEIAHLHAASEYVVFAPGTGPGFGYLFGLPPRLFTPRHMTPVMRPTGGLVSIGGAQSNLGGPRQENGPATHPTGWHAIGHAPNVPVPFDLSRERPNLLDMGDRIIFRVERVEA
ncbi:5-oxoprolinase subunit PxpB [Achromobacter aloeverae]